MAERNPKFTDPAGHKMWGIPGLTGSTTDGSDGWYVAGRDGRGGWRPIHAGRTPDTLGRQVRAANSVVVAMVRGGQILGYRTVHGPITSLKTLRQLIEREVETGSPV